MNDPRIRPHVANKYLFLNVRICKCVHFSVSQNNTQTYPSNVEATQYNIVKSSFNDKMHNRTAIQT